MKRHYTILILVIVSLAVVACGGGTAASSTPSGGVPAAVLTQGGNYTPLGGVQKNNQPTASDFADLQAAEHGTLGQPVLVEFYADY